MINHSPGPWAVHARLKECITTKRGAPVADCVGPAPAEVQAANAVLIASAPDMAATLELIARFCEANQDGALDLRWVYQQATEQLLRSIGGRYGPK